MLNYAEDTHDREQPDSRPDVARRDLQEADGVTIIRDNTIYDNGSGGTATGLHISVNRADSDLNRIPHLEVYNNFLNRWFHNRIWSTSSATTASS